MLLCQLSEKCHTQRNLRAQVVAGVVRGQSFHGDGLRKPISGSRVIRHHPEHWFCWALKPVVSVDGVLRTEFSWNLFLVAGAA